MGPHELGIDQQRTMLDSLMAGQHPPPRLIETHISWLLLDGSHVYKIKKALDLGFLDYTSLEKRLHYCREELRLNRRTAPELYLDVVPITGTPSTATLGGAGPVIDFAVKMREFPQQTLFDRALAEDRVTPAHIDLLAEQLARFHQSVEPVSPDAPFGDPDVVLQPMLDNFHALRQTLHEPIQRIWLDEQEAKITAQFAALQADLLQRKQTGFVRECHGDLHLGNMTLHDDTVRFFDCIEFSPRLRWIDVVSELAFTLMDLDARERPQLAQRLANGYFERTGDYHGLRLLRFYQHYRAMVRAKVTALRLAQTEHEPATRLELIERIGAYLTLAEHYSHPPTTRLIITHGPSGTGKTFQTQPLLESLGALRIRSDVERKRLFGLVAGQPSASAVDGGIYRREASDRTYARLEALAAAILASGYSVIVDATFLESARREPFRALAQHLGIPFHILTFHADEALLKQRITQRQRQGSDASEANLAVLARQLAAREPLLEDEMPHVITIDAASAVDSDQLLRRITFAEEGQVKPQSYPT